MPGANSTTIGLLKKYDFSIQKKYGQNFLIDDNILNGIVESADIHSDDIVLEIGPGLGALTGLLCRKARHVVAVEIDRMLIPILQESLSNHDNLTLINDDILKVDIADIVNDVIPDDCDSRVYADNREMYPNGYESENMQAGDNGECKAYKQLPGKIKVVANLPYYITTPVIMALLERESCISSITVMIQKEVAQRMNEKPGSKSYGALSLAVQYYAKTNYIMTVSKNCFIPKPDVDSAVIRLDIHDPDERPVKAENPDMMFRIIRAAFNQRRKTLVNALGNSQDLKLSKDAVMDTLQKMGKPETVRGEAFSLAEFARLSDLLA